MISPKDSSETATTTQRLIKGKVVRQAIDKTARIECEWQEKHATGKYIDRTTTYLVHDENNDCRQGDTVMIYQTRPYSKRKFMCLHSIVDKS